MNGSSGWLVVLAVIAVVAIAAISGLNPGAYSGDAADKAPSGEASSPPRASHPIVVNHPAGPPRIATGKTDGLGREITLSCASCHANRLPDLETSRGKELTEFHQGLHFSHGTLKCVSCHNPGDYNSLRLAEGRSVPFAEVQSLCAQCHTPQARDYQHGAHGGMNGHWDLSRGPRQRKGCIDCHDPHAPKFPGMVPTFKSRDRFLAPLYESKSHE